MQLDRDGSSKIVQAFQSRKHSVSSIGGSLYYHVMQGGSIRHVNTEVSYIVASRLGVDLM